MYLKVDEMFGFLPEEKTPATVSAPTAFKVSVSCDVLFLALCLLFN